MVFWLGNEHEYKLFPSALITRAIDWVVVSSEGGVEVSSAAATMLRFGLAMVMSNMASNPRVFRSPKVTVSGNQEEGLAAD